MTDLRLQSSAVPEVARIQVIGAVASSADEGICLLATMKNKGRTQLSIRFWQEFDEISLSVEMKVTNDFIHYVRVEPRPVEPRSPFHSVWTQFIPPSETASWKVPLRRYYDLKPGQYRGFLTIRFNVESGPSPWDVLSKTGSQTIHSKVMSAWKTYSTSITTGPLEFEIPNN